MHLEISSAKWRPSNYMPSNVCDEITYPFLNFIPCLIFFSNCLDRDTCFTDKSSGGNHAANTPTEKTQDFVRDALLAMLKTPFTPSEVNLTYNDILIIIKAGKRLGRWVGGGGGGGGVGGGGWGGGVGVGVGGAVKFGWVGWVWNIQLAEKLCKSNTTFTTK